MKISEIFYSIEGEGIQIGRREIFIRLAGCNLECSWCDTKYARQNGKEMDVKDAISRIVKYPCKSVSITGGEPLCQIEEVVKLVKQLKNHAYWIQINTNGTIFHKRIFDSVDLISMDCKCPSSGMQSDQRVLGKTRELYDHKTQFKFVVANRMDYEYAKRIIERLSPLNVVIQPEWAHRKFAKQLVEFAKKDGLDSRVILQQHKIVWGSKKGV
ncbi:MAG: radical SAM protein [Candidatus Bathyarchaeia archaeon]